MVGKKFYTVDFEGRHEHQILSFDGDMYTVAYLHGGNVVHEFKLSPDDLDWLLEDAVEIGA